MNHINTWQQGKFVDQLKYKNWSPLDKVRAQQEESLLVRPAPLENAICRCSEASRAEWIAERLNLASTLERMTYDFATGESDGQDLVKFVRDSLFS
jgi:hypothetical protein